MTGLCIAPGADRRPCHAPCTPGSAFCEGHASAPAVRRGGWLSAERRRRQRVGGAEPVAFDVSNIAPRLWLSAMPPLDRDLPAFDLLVLCAADMTRDRLPFRGRVLRCPLPRTLTIYDIRRAITAARAVAAALREGRTVLVSCATGHDASALVAALGLGLATTMSPSAIVALIRGRRSSDCLQQPQATQVLDLYLRRRR